MTDTTVVALPSDRTTNFDWGAIIGGALIASALSFVLFWFGSAAGVASVSPYSWNNPSTATLTIMAAAYFSVVMIGSFLVGGYFAGRYRRPAGGSTSVEERQSRDGAHGLLMWAVSVLLGLGMAYCMAALTARNVATVVGGAAAGAAQTASYDAVNPLIDRMLRPATTDAQQPAGNQNPQAEISRVISTGTLTRGEISPQDRDYVAGIVAREARIPQDKARKRVDATIENAKEVANKARKVTVGLAFLIGALSILAAGAAYWAAMAGGREREENVWR
jgi:hypothetical protein